MKNNKKIIGMIHLPPTMSYDGWLGMEETLEHAAKDLKALELGGADGALIENDGDSPCQVEGKPEVVIPMTVVALELKRIAKIPLGIEVLLNDPKASLAIAKCCDLQMIRTDYFVDKMERGGYGEFEIDPEGLMMHKKRISAESVSVLADVQVKFARMLEKKSMNQSVNQAIEAGAGGVIVSGVVTGKKPNVNDLKEAKKAADGRVPVIVGSGFSESNASLLMKYADWAIFGNSIKTSGLVDAGKVEQLVKAAKA